MLNLVVVDYLIAYLLSVNTFKQHIFSTNFTPTNFICGKLIHIYFVYTQVLHLPPPTTPTQVSI